MKKVLLILLTMVFLCGCQKKNEEIRLIVWSFTDELGGMINRYYKPVHPEIRIDYSFTPSEQFPNKLDLVLASGQGAPDIFALEDAFVRKYIESGLLLDLTDIYEANRNKMLAYPVQVGSSNGRVYGMSWQATPGAMFYRRSFAKKYLGTDDPAEVQSYFANMNKFLETAQLLKDRSNGACVMVSSGRDLLRPFLSARKDPWVINDKLIVDPSMEQYMEITRILRDKKWEGQVAQWSEGWFAGMQDALRDVNGNTLEVFSYFLPTWGLHYILKQNARETSGDWAMIPGPAPYRWGGTWISAWKNTKKPAAVKELIRLLTTDDTILEQYALDSGDLVSNMIVVDKIKDSYSEPFLGGQNHYAEFAAMARNVDGRLNQGTDQVIESLFIEAVEAFVNGEKSQAQVLGDFKAQVENQLGLK